MKNAASGREMPKLVFVLFAITLVTSALLATVYYITAPSIAENLSARTSDAIRIVMPADEYKAVSYTGDDPLISSVTMALTNGEQIGWVVEALPSGFGGVITMEVGIDMYGAITGITIVSMSETPNLGTNAKNESFLNQYTESPGPFSVNKDGGTIEALTGATITSRAVTKGVNSAIEAIQYTG